MNTPQVAWWFSAQDSPVWDFLFLCPNADSSNCDNAQQFQEEVKGQAHQVSTHGGLFLGHSPYRHQNLQCSNLWYEME